MNSDRLDDTEGEGSGVFSKADPDCMARRAFDHFVRDDLTCGEAILLAGCEEMGVQSDVIPDIALAFCGGMGLTGRTCGALTGAMLVIGIAAGRVEKDYAKKLEMSIETGALMISRFREAHKADDCRTLCGLDLTTPKGLAGMTENELIHISG